MRAGIVCSAVIVAMSCASVASAAMVFPNGGITPDGDPLFNVGPNFQVRTYDQVKVMPQQTLKETIAWTPNLGGVMDLNLMGTVLLGQADFWAEYLDGKGMVCTAVQSIGQGFFSMTANLDTIPSQAFLYLRNNSSDTSFVIKSGLLIVQTAGNVVPEPATLALLAMAAGMMVIRRRRSH